MCSNNEDSGFIRSQILKITDGGSQIRISEEKYWCHGHLQLKDNRGHESLLLQHAHAIHLPFYIYPAIDAIVLDGIRAADLKSLAEHYTLWPELVHNIIVEEDDTWRDLASVVPLLRGFENLRLIQVHLSERRSCVKSGSVLAGGYRQRAEALLARDMIALRGYGSWIVRYVDHGGSLYLQFETTPRYGVARARHGSDQAS